MLGPGPAEYKLPTTIGFHDHDPRKRRNPMYTMRGTHAQPLESIVPGPANYSLGKQTRIGNPHSRMYSIGIRLQQAKPDLGPGPGAHENHRVPTMNFRRAPHYSFGQRLDLPNKDTVPGPNQYDVVLHMTRPKAPSYSMRYRTKELEGYDGPGPAKYSLPSCNVTLRRSPNYSVRGVHALPVDRCPHPGPNHYGLMNLRMDRTAPSYTFGIQYPHWKQPMIVPGDNC